MRLRLSVIAALSALALPVLAHADTFDNFTITGHGLDLTFTLPSDPKPIDSVPSDLFEIGPMTFTENGVQVADSDVFFYVKADGGGFQLEDANNNIIDDLSFNGPALFTGGVKDPTFKTGDFTLTDDPSCEVPAIQGDAKNNCSYSLTIAPAPEPSSLALLGTGLLGATGVLRRRIFG